MTESIKHTEYTSGLIDRKGNFYPCSDEQHHYLEYKLQDEGLLKDTYRSAEKAGWLTLTTSQMTEVEFTYNFEKSKLGLTKKQIQAIKDYKLGKEEDFLNFNFNWYHISQVDEFRDSGNKMNYDIETLTCGRSGNKANQLAFLKYLKLPIPTFYTFKCYWNSEYTLEEVIRKSFFYEDLELVSVRSSSKYSIPGLFKTVLNVKPLSEDFNKAIIEVNKSLKSDESLKFAKSFNTKIENPSIIIQKMIQSDKNKNSGAAIIHTNNKSISGIYTINNLGSILVSNKSEGISIDKLDKKLYNKILKLSNKVVNKIGKEQELEFAWEDSKVFILQTRDYKEIEPIYEDQINNLILDLNFAFNNGGRNGKFVTKAIDEPYILYKDFIDTEDIKFPNQCKGIISKNGSKYSHAASIARGLNIPYCVSNLDLSKYLNKKIYFKTYE